MIFIKIKKNYAAFKPYTMMNFYQSHPKFRFKETDRMPEQMKSGGPSKTTRLSNFVPKNKKRRRWQL